MPYKIGIDARKLSEPGIGGYVQNLVRGLAGLDEENSYALFVGPNYDGEFDQLPPNLLRVVERSPVYSVRERAALSWRLFRQRLDLYHATHYILPLWVPAETVATVHDIVHLLHPNFIPGRLATLVAQTQIRYSLSRSSRIIAESDSTKADIEEYFEIPAWRIRRIYHGVSEVFTPEPDPQDKTLREELGVGDSYVLFVGGERPHRNEERALRAFAAARRSVDSDARLVMLGERELSTQRFEHLAAELELEDRLTLCDPLAAPRRAALIRGAALFLHPTLYEGFPTPVVEAMACGAPIITSNCATIREIAEGAAKLVEPSSVDSLTSAIGWCLQDDGLQRTLAADALERAAGFDWHSLAEQTLELYLETLANGSDRRRLLRRGSSS